MYRHLALFINKHVVRTIHNHALFFLRPTVNDHIIYRGHELSVTWWQL